MKIKIEADKESKITIMIALILVFVIAFIYNRRYLYILDAEFEDGIATQIILKTGFVFPVKTSIQMRDNFKVKIKIYGYNVLVLKDDKNFNVFLNNKKIQTIYPDAYYDETHKKPVGRIHL